MSGKQVWLAARLGRLLGAVGFLAIAGALVYGLFLAAISPANTVVLGALATLLTFFVSKSYEFRKQREAALAEKKRTVYRGLLAPWEKLLVELKADKPVEGAITPELLAAVYGSAFDTVLYGSETVIRKYAEFRAPESAHDPIDLLRALAAVLVAMREDVTGQKSTVPEDVVLRTFMNLSSEQLLLVRLREYVSKNPDAQRKVAELVAGTTQRSATEPPKGAG